MRRRARPGLALGLLTAALAAATPAGAGEVISRPGVLRDLAYAAASPAEGRELDLYLPAAGGGAPPLVAFVHSRFWSRVDSARFVEARLARALQSEGAAVAVIRHRLAPEHRHPAHAEDVAAALAYLVQGAPRWGYDAGRIFLAGHSSGAHLAALVALDPRYLAAHGLEPGRLAGVIAISGIYDLDPDDLSDEERAWYEQAFGGRGDRRGASPLRHVRADAPPFLVLTAENEIPGYAEAGFAFSAALRDAGHSNAETFAVLGSDHVTVLDLADERNSARHHVLAFAGLSPMSGPMQEMFAARRYWRKPGFSTEGFWSHGSLVKEYEADERFVQESNRVFVTPANPRLRVRPSRYHAVDLFAYLEALDPERARRGPWLTVTNARGERAVWRVDALRAHRPRIVIGIDDERNLFRVTDVYHTLRGYTWTEPEPRPRAMARPMGAFLFFPEESPGELGSLVFGRYGLTPESFHLSESDPLAAIRDLPPDLRDFITLEAGCVNCHTFRGAGARAAHIRASDGALVDGHALALEAYPPEVWRRYVFEQEAVAAEIGATVVPLDAEFAQRLFDLVERGRAAAGP